jgi:hypothetical protein
MCINQAVPGGDQFGGAALKGKVSTGFALLDEAINGLPRKDSLIYLVGEDEHCKSTVPDNLIIRLLEHNEDVIVFLHTVEATLSTRIPRIKGAKYNYPSKYFRKAGYFLKNVAALPPRYRNFEGVNTKASTWINQMVNSERLILADVAGLPPQLPALEQWIRAIRTKFPNKPLVVLADNFHLYDLPGYEPSEAKAGEMHRFLKRLTTQYRCTILMPEQLSNTWSCPGDRPRMAGGAKSPVAASKASATFSICDELKDLGDRAKLVWYDIDADQEAVDVDGQETF